MDSRATALVRDDGRLARVPHGAMPIEGHARVAGEEVRIDSRREVPVEQPDPDDLGLLHDQVVGQALDVGQRAAPERVLDGKPDRRTRDAHPQIELGPPLRALFADEEVREECHDQNHRHEEE